MLYIKSVFLRGASITLLCMIKLWIQTPSFTNEFLPIVSSYGWYSSSERSWVQSWKGRSVGHFCLGLSMALLL